MQKFYKLQIIIARTIIAITITNMKIRIPQEKEYLAFGSFFFI